MAKRGKYDKKEVQLMKARKLYGCSNRSKSETLMGISFGLLSAGPPSSLIHGEHSVAGAESLEIVLKKEDVMILSCRGFFGQKDCQVKTMVVANRSYAGSLKKRGVRFPPKRGKVKVEIFRSIFKFVLAMAVGKQRGRKERKVMAEEGYVSISCCKENVEVIEAMHEF